MANLDTTVPRKPKRIDPLWIAAGGSGLATAGLFVAGATVWLNATTENEGAAGMLSVGCGWLAAALSGAERPGDYLSASELVNMGLGLAIFALSLRWATRAGATRAVRSVELL